MQINKSKIIGVMGSGTAPHKNLAYPLGRWIAERGYHLLTGGGQGIMASVSQSFTSVHPRPGRCIGIIPCLSENRPGIPKTGYPNPYIEIPINTHLPLSGNQGADMLSRNHINILSSDLIISLPGSAGTISETRLAIKYKKPVLAFLNTKDEMPHISDEIEVYTEFEELTAGINGLMQ